MKLFKKHKTKDKVTFNVGIRECRTCDNNMRCEECAYPSENEMLKAEVERLLNPTTALWRQAYYHSQTLLTDGRIYKSQYKDGYICSRCGKKSWVAKDICDGCKSVMKNAKGGDKGGK